MISEVKGCPWPLEVLDLGGQRVPMAIGTRVFQKDPDRIFRTDRLSEIFVSQTLACASPRASREVHRSAPSPKVAPTRPWTPSGKRTRRASSAAVGRSTSSSTHLRDGKRLLTLLGASAPGVQALPQTVVGRGSPSMGLEQMAGSAGSAGVSPAPRRSRVRSCRKRRRSRLLFRRRP